MGWIIGGLLTAIFLETFIRITSNYKPITEDKKKDKVTIDVPWYGKAILGIWFWKWLTKKEK